MGSIFVIVDHYHSGRAERGNVVDNAGISSAGGRPHYGGGWAMKWELHNWLLDQGVPTYRFHWAREQQPVWEVEIEDGYVDAAMLLMMKLR